MMKMAMRPQIAQYPKRKQAFESSGIFDAGSARQWGARAAKIRVIGGAGCAALGAGTATGGGGGGGGGSTTKYQQLLAPLPAWVPITVGAAGVLVSVSGQPSEGGPGGYSQFGNDGDTHVIRAGGGQGGENPAGSSGTAFRGGSAGIGYRPGSTSISDVTAAISPATRGVGGNGTSFNDADPNVGYRITSGAGGGWGKNGASLACTNGGTGGSTSEGSAPPSSQGTITGGGGGGAPGLWAVGSNLYFGTGDSFGYSSDAAAYGAVFIELS